MDKKLKACIEYIESEYKGKNKKASEELISYHLQMVQHFQHERLVHLIVTMFFALFLLIFFAMFIFMSITLAKCGEFLIIGEPCHQPPADMSRSDADVRRRISRA